MYINFLSRGMVEREPEGTESPQSLLHKRYGGVLLVACSIAYLGGKGPKQNKKQNQKETNKSFVQVRCNKVTVAGLSVSHAMEEVFFVKKI